MLFLFKRNIFFSFENVYFYKCIRLQKEIIITISLYQKGKVNVFVDILILMKNIKFLLGNFQPKATHTYLSLSY